jgi:hypothetical protein
MTAVQNRLSRGLLGRVALLVALLLGTMPTSAVAFSKAVWGTVDRNGVDQFPIYRHLGASIFEYQLNWNDVAPTRPAKPTNPADPAYRWPQEVQDAIAQARTSHMRVLLRLIFAPPWANGGHAPNWAPLKPKDFAAFATAAARRYPRVHLWMIWGEPNRAGDFEPITRTPYYAKLNQAQQVAPHRYAQILDAAYAALKSVSRDNKVIGGCTFTAGDISTEQWIQNLRLPDGRPPRMDMYAQNPFGYTEPSFTAPPSPYGLVQFSDLPRMAGWIDRYLRRGMPIFIAEWTIPTHPDEEFPWWVGPKVAARWITDALSLARHWKRIYALGWVHVYDDPPVSYGGLLTAAGQPKLGFKAFARG